MKRKVGGEFCWPRTALAAIVVLSVLLTLAACGVEDTLPVDSGTTVTVVTGPTSGAGVPGDPLDEEYAVWSALIQTSYIDATSPALIVIKDATPVSSGAESASNMAPYDWPQLGTEIWTDFDRKNQTPFMLERRFTLSVEYVFISEQELASIFSSSGGEWPAFYAKYPDSQGVLTLWRVGFNGARDTAVVYATNLRGFLNGEGTLFLLEKTAGRWTVRLNSLIMVS